MSSAGARGMITPGGNSPFLLTAFSLNYRAYSDAHFLRACETQAVILL